MTKFEGEDMDEIGEIYYEEMNYEDKENEEELEEENINKETAILNPKFFTFFI